MRRPLSLAVRTALSGFVVAAVMTSAATPAAAYSITKLSDGVALTMPDNGAGVSAGRLGDQAFVFSETLSNTYFGRTTQIDFPRSNSWSGVPAAGLDAATGALTIVFDTPISAFLADLNWQVFGSNRKPITFEAIGSNGLVIESHSLTNGVNSNFWDPDSPFGIKRDANEIFAIRMSNGYVAFRDASFERLSSAVPEPATWALMIVGFGAAGAMVRSQRRRTETAFA